MTDLDDRSIADFTGGITWFPRCACRALVDIVEFGDFKNESKMGYDTKVQIVEVQSTKSNPNFDPLPLVGKAYTVGFTEVGEKYPDQVTRNMKALRTLLCAMQGKEHDPNVKTNQLLTDLVKLDKGQLSEAEQTALLQKTKFRVILDVDARPGTPNEETGQVWVKTFFEFHPAP